MKVDVSTVLTQLNGDPFKEPRYGPVQQTATGPVQILLPADQRPDLTLGAACVAALEQPIDPKTVTSSKELRAAHQTRQGLAVKLFAAVGEKAEVELTHDEVGLLLELLPLCFQQPTLVGQAMKLLGG